MGFILGLVVGAVSALLYGPKVGMGGEELRQRADDLKRRADDLQRIAQKMAGDVQTKGREVIDDAKREWDKSAAGTAETASGGSSTGGTTTAGSTGARSSGGIGSPKA